MLPSRINRSPAIGGGFWRPLQVAGSTVEGALSGGGSLGRDRQELAQWGLGVPWAWHPKSGGGKVAGEVLLLKIVG